MINKTTAPPAVMLIAPGLREVRPSPLQRYPTKLGKFFISWVSSAFTFVLSLRLKEMPRLRRAAVSNLVTYLLPLCCFLLQHLGGAHFRKTVRNLTVNGACTVDLCSALLSSRQNGGRLDGCGDGSSCSRCSHSYSEFSLGGSQEALVPVEATGKRGANLLGRFPARGERKGPLEGERGCDPGRAKGWMIFVQGGRRATDGNSEKCDS